MRSTGLWGRSLSSNYPHKHKRRMPLSQALTGVHGRALQKLEHNDLTTVCLWVQIGESSCCQLSQKSEIKKTPSSKTMLRLLLFLS